MIEENSQIKIVGSFEELTTKKFQGSTNALCWKRELRGNFEELVSKLELKENITEISQEDLLKLSLSEDGIFARNSILEDMKNLEKFGAQPSLNLLQYYEKDDEFDFISTDVYSYHVDRSPVLIDTYLCTYFGAPSDIIKNAECRKKIDIPEVRAQIKNLFDGSEEGFENFIKENFFDLHYEALDSAKPTNLGNSHLWRLAVDHPQQNVQPCVHRAPLENNQLRLMLIC